MPHIIIRPNAVDIQPVGPIRHDGRRREKSATHCNNFGQLCLGNLGTPPELLDSSRQLGEEERDSDFILTALPSPPTVVPPAMPPGAMLAISVLIRCLGALVTYTALSVPSAKMSSRPLPHETATGSEFRVPPTATVSVSFFVP